MTIKEEMQGDVFEAIDAREKNTIFMHGCNMQGRMGSGVAKVVRSKWPSTYEQYKQACSSQENPITLGMVFMDAPEIGASKPNLLVAHSFTQEFYGRSGGPYADLDAIESCIHEVEHSFALEDEVALVTVRIGSGLGGLDWDTEVKPLLENSNKDWTVYYL